MKLLFDQNLSQKLVGRLNDSFPNSAHVLPLGLDKADDHTIWQCAKLNGFALVTQDSDFADLSAVFGSPPKIIWLRCGNRPTHKIEDLLRRHARIIDAFNDDPQVDCLEIL